MEGIGGITEAGYRRYVTERLRVGYIYTMPVEQQSNELFRGRKKIKMMVEMKVTGLYPHFVGFIDSRGGYYNYSYADVYAMMEDM